MWPPNYVISFPFSGRLVLIGFFFLQGINIFKDFDIKSEAGGVDKEVIKTLNNVSVTNTTLEIRFQYAGKGTTAVPVRGLYGPLISAISMEAGTYAYYSHHLVSLTLHHKQSLHYTML